MIKVIEPKDIGIQHIDKVVEITASFINSELSATNKPYKHYGRLSAFTITRDVSVFVLRDKTEPITINLRNMRCTISYYEKEENGDRERPERSAH